MAAELAAAPETEPLQGEATGAAAATSPSRLGGWMAAAQETARAGLDRGALGVHLSAAQEVIQRRGAEYAELGKNLHTLVKERSGVDVAALAMAGFGLKDEFGVRYEAAKREGQKRLFDLGKPARARIMFGLLCATKASATSDPDMCQCVREGIDDLVTLFWADLTVFVEQMFEDQKEATLGITATTVEELGELGHKPMLCGLRWWRSFVLYHSMPYDRSVFGQVKDPVFWILTLLSLIPLYGIRVCFFSMLLLLILAGSPPDEYQLVTYIIGFKGSQFISSGIIQAVIAAVKYYLCVHPGGTHSCDTDGPGANQDVVSGTIDFLGSCILTWMAFLSLPCSDRSAGMRDAVEQAGEIVAPAAASTGCCCSPSYDLSRGGRLRNLLGYDVVTFALSCGLLLLLMYVDASHSRPGGLTARTVSMEEVLGDAGTWQGHTGIFWARVFYSLLSFPFIVFLIPGLNSILTHTTATGYNRNGLCVPFMMHPMPKEDKAK